MEMGQQRVDAARNYSRFVTGMKLILPSLAAVLLGGVLAWPQITERAEDLSVEFTALDRGQADLGSVINPRYVGIDDQNQPYTVTADIATEMEDGSDRMRLTNPKGDIVQNTGRWMSVTSDLGYLTNGNQRVELEHDVMLYRDDGFQFETARAFIRMDEDYAFGEEPVKGQGDGMEITSVDGFDVTEGGDVIVFRGKSHLILQDAKSAGLSPGGGSGGTGKGDAK
ncbi:MAG: LPS export ABC transporter periplasmic protein LptC [Rhodospirillum sp.]|nr:LPS export ABC transporter periplasmic protein LptC [Rhodospirillum sp.]MCF8487545.1 LPS export ABC transporter periplasmic protein LptC [Rhodospirillum sp.]MCF8499028.1 LPS export ABC transporter periplasmic protein LptC [Rhodospirillum sp.]